MKIKIQVIIEAEGGNPEIVQEIGQLERAALRVEEFGLTLAEAKAFLQGVQKTMVEQQSAEYLRQQACCSQCGRKRLHKGEHQIVYRTLFGKLRLESLRLYHCPCQEHARRSFSPLAELLQERSAPELLYVESKFAALMSYGLTADVLQETPAARRNDPSNDDSESRAAGGRADGRRTWGRKGVLHRRLRAGLGARAAAGLAVDGGTGWRICALLRCEISDRWLVCGDHRQKYAGGWGGQVFRVRKDLR
jgi:hypothetical protein